MTDVLIRRGNLDTQTQKEDDAETQGEDDHPQAKESLLGQVLPSRPLEGTNPADTLILDSSLQN